VKSSKLTVTKWFISKLLLCSLKSFGLQKIRIDPQTKDTDKEYDIPPYLFGRKYVEE
jgi:hypothetical protein